MNALFQKLIVTVFVALLFVTPGIFAHAYGEDTPEASRAKLLSYVLRQQLTQNHFSHKPIDDDLSRAAYDLYIKQLDFQKRFLLQEDIGKLKKFSTKIDDELKLGQVELPVVAAQLMNDRIGQVKEITAELLEKDFDFSLSESLETDPDKLDWCKTMAELRERWRKILKLQVLNTMFILEEDKEDQKESGATDPKQVLPLQQRARDKVAKRFEHFFDRLLKDTPRDHYDRYFNAVTRAFDPHTSYFPPQEKEDFEIGMRGSLEGIGATLREEDGFIKVVRIIPGSAAARQGDLDAEDIILAVGQGKEEPVDVTDTRLRDAVELIRGPKGSEVRLTVKKADGHHKVIAIVRDVVEIEETFVKSTLLQDQTGTRKFGYIRIPSFYRDFQSPFMGGSGRNVTDDVAAALKELNQQKISGLIIDLRNNGGGALTDAVKVSGLFIDQGPVVQVKSSDGDVQILEDRDAGVAYDGPIAVLVNEFSASASEILAAALQDYRRATIIGSEHTYGKGTVQTILDLDRSVPFRNMEKYKPLGALKITTQKFYRVSGGSTQAKGVESDLVLPDTMQYLKSGEKYIDYALPWDTVPASDFHPWSGTGSLNLEQLRQRSLARRQQSEKFQEIIEDAEFAKENRDKTQVSLNLDQARKEREERRLGKGSELSGHGEQPESDEKVSTAKTEKERLAEWSKQVAEDPYALEALAVLTDTLPQGGQQTAGSTN